MLKNDLQQAQAGQPLWLPDLREAFLRDEDAAPLVLRVRSFDGQTRDFAHRLPRWRDEAERALVRDYLHASVYNTLSVCGGYEVTFFLDPRETEITALLDELPEVFQLRAPRRRGLGKVVSIANRMGRAFGGKTFAFTTADIKDYAPAGEPPRTHAPLTETLQALCREGERTGCVGVDVGGTDIKLAASKNGKLIAVKEYDWNPASFESIDALIDPILLLTRLMRACIASDG